MKSIWTCGLALGTMLAPTVNLASAAIDPAAFLSDVRLEWPVDRTSAYHLNASLFPSNRPVRVPDLHRPQLSGHNRPVNGTLVQANTDSSSLFPNINVGGDAYDKNTKQDLGDNDAKNLTYRIPFENITPYVYGGAGYKFDNKFDNLRPQFEQMGVGTEFHLMDNWSVYVDGRYVFRGDTPDASLARAGFRFSF